MRRRHFVWALAALVAAACADAGPSEPDNGLGPLAELYLGDAVDIMEGNSIRKYEIDWIAFREATYTDAAGARSPVDTYPAIVAALERIGDNHSFFSPRGGQARPTLPMSASQAAGTPTTTASRAGGLAAVDPMAELIRPGIGYVDVPAFNGGGQDANGLATAYHRLIEGVDTLGGACRWVVDIRGNTGGNMWPMVAGVGPVLGEGTVGFFVDPDSVVSPWFYENGQSGVGDFVLVDVPTPYELSYPLPWVGVLTDSLTASSGEAVAVAFRGRPSTRSFGEPTWGVSTANSAFPLSDGAVIFLTVATMADRLGNVYGEELVPDEVVLGGTKTGDPESDDVLAAALQWLSGQACT
jgi:peptidase S41-like protein